MFRRRSARWRILGRACIFNRAVERFAPRR